MKLNLGAGRNVLDGWINVDSQRLPGINVVFDLDRCGMFPFNLPFDDDSVDQILLSHILEHLHNPLPLMQELHRVAKNGAIMEIRVPHGSHDNAWEDQTHVRSYTQGSFIYFSQPTYHFADYGYKGDWKTDKILLVGSQENFDDGMSVKEVVSAMNTYRNLVHEMRAYLSAVKPIRVAGKDYIDRPDISVHLTP